MGPTCHQESGRFPTGMVPYWKPSIWSLLLAGWVFDSGHKQISLGKWEPLPLGPSIISIPAPILTTKHACFCWTGSSVASGRAWPMSSGQVIVSLVVQSLFCDRCSPLGRNVKQRSPYFILLSWVWNVSFSRPLYFPSPHLSPLYGFSSHELAGARAGKSHGWRSLAGCSPWGC